MTLEERTILFNEICEMNPYGTLLQDMEYNLRPVPGGILDNWHKEIKLFGDEQYRPVEYIRPYLRPLESMTSDEEKELSDLLNYEFYVDQDFALVAEDDRHRIRLDLIQKYFEWLKSHHFDYKGLIDKGLALKAPKDMYDK